MLARTVCETAFERATAKSWFIIIIVALITVFLIA